MVEGQKTGKDNAVDVQNSRGSDMLPYVHLHSPAMLVEWLVFQHRAQACSLSEL